MDAIDVIDAIEDAIDVIDAMCNTSWMELHHCDTIQKASQGLCWIGSTVDASVDLGIQEYGGTQA